MSIRKSEIEFIEELNLNAWPALSQVVIDGWIVRLSEGYTRRANSANALKPGSAPASDLLDQFERNFSRHGLRCAVRVTPLVPADALSELDARHYASEGETSVMTTAIPSGEIDPRVEISPSVTPEWLHGYAATNPRKDFQAATLEKILRLIVPEAGFALSRQDGKAVSFAIGVLERGHLAVLNVATHPAVRRGGHSRRVLSSLFAWARERGAHTSHLNVQADNAAAVPHYTSLGFREIYRYLYRVKPDA